MSILSPFATSRFEYESRHVYYLPHEVFEELEDPKPTYLIGCRGTGKTTLLKALNWDERLENISLRKQLREKPFIKKYIGVYLKAPEFQLEEFDKWLENESEATYGAFLAYFIDILSTALISDGIVALIREKILKISPKEEHEAMTEIIDWEDNPLRKLLSERGPHTLRDLSKACKRAGFEWQRCAQSKVNVSTIAAKVPTGQAGIFGRVVGKILGRLCDKASPDGRWHFKVCVDETETLHTKQQLVLNTMVRLAAWPLFPVLSFVSLPQELTKTLIPGLTLGKADRNLKVIDEISDKEFRDLAEGVARVRVRHYLNRPRANFDLEKLLGHWNVNILLDSMLKQSAKKEAAQLLARAEVMGREPFFVEKDIAPDHGDEFYARRVPPIYQTYLIEQLNLAVPKPDDAQWKRRGQESAELRKRIAAAYLSICKEFGLEVRYASAEVVLQLSDNCARDFLAQVEAIYRASKKSIANFLDVRIPFLSQSEPLRNASLEKGRSLVKFGVRAPSDTGRLVDGLARITAMVQTSGFNSQHLRSSERGLFELDLQEATRRSMSSYVQLILDASEAGFLRGCIKDQRTLQFRVHTSLAAAYGFSYRGAYYPVRLGWNDVDRIVSAESEAEHDRVILDVGKRLAGQEIDDMPLFAGIKEKRHE